ncbi:hypothetical protein AZH53_02435 [Methanomicrobiaceae archaeon CYW5]|uniref:TIGR04084 family radical SAM/SPASM domain-containing protein n=1 Tax=Methanovulcanius yangii TaxID=1789227 RepID=UPI0029CAA3CF|nr:TIGR04084 family radical SAM/SPASM domain-containing protein [Methanovulcanius yangii]MBT8507287.1 hypothetical protein [Methanovulcanius yangii]
MHYHLLVNDQCNLHCRYCKGNIFRPDLCDAWRELPFACESDIQYPLFELERFLKEDPDPVVTFYGGEPLMSSDTVREIMDSMPEVRFMLHTNGILLDRIDPEYLNAMSSILISIDGREQVHDKHRGKGTYRLIMENCRRLLETGYEGELIGRMTVTEDTDIFRDVLHLSRNELCSFQAVHWQLNANFYDDYGARNFGDWACSSYIPGLQALAAEWVLEMELDGKVRMWYPFVDTMQDLLMGDLPAMLRCGSGHANYSILPDGNIAPCPCMGGLEDYYAGHIRDADPKNLPRIAVDNECRGCDEYAFCGGRCLYSNIFNPWPAEGRTWIYRTVRALHETMTEVRENVGELICTGRISMDQFAHQKYHGCEIIP